MANAAKAEQYAEWIVNNQDKKGTPDFETVKKAYLEVRPSSAGEKAEGFGRGINVGLSDIFGAPVDLANQLPKLLNLLPGEQGFGAFSENPVGGSQSIRNLLSDKLDLGYKDINQLPASQRPFAVGGEVVGQTAGTLLPVVGQASKIKAPRVVSTVQAPKGNLLSQTADDLLMAQARNPVAAITAETAMSAAPAVGAGFAEAIDPGDPTSRLYGELAGAFSLPVVMSNTLPALTTSLRRVIETKVLPGGKEREAARIVQKRLSDAGEDPKAVAEALRESGDNMTSGIATNSPALLAIEKQFISEGGEVSDALKKQVKAVIEDFNAEFRAAVKTGDPEAIRQAAQARQEHVISALNQIAKRAEAKAKKAQEFGLRANLGDNAQMAASKKAREILDDALRVARNTESQLWAEVPKDISVQPTAFTSKFDEMKAELLSQESLPDGPVVKFRDDLEGTTTTGDLLRARSRYLEQARMLRSQGKFGDARRVQNIADAALQDLDGVVGGSAKVAREFSRELNEKFTQGFVGKTLGYDRTGAPSVDQRVTLERAARGSDTDQLVNLQSMQRAAGENAADMKAAQEDFLTAMARGSANFDGSLNPQALENFIKQNRATINELGLQDTLADVAGRRRIADQLAERAASGTAFARQKSTAARVLQVNNANDAVKRALTSNNTSEQLGDLARLAKRSRDPSVMEGLQYATLETLLDAATSSKGMISGSGLEALLAQKTGGTTVRGALSDTGVLTQSQLKNIDRIVAKSKNLEQALASTDRAEDLLGTSDLLFDLLLRIGGANVGSMSAASGATGAPLVLAGAASRSARTAFDKMPKLRVKSIIAEAVKNPKLMADLLSKPTSATARAARDRRVNAVLIQAGILDGSEIVSQEENQ